MDEARAVLSRLDRIEALENEGAPAGVLLAEVRALLAESEAWVRAEPWGTELAENAVERLRKALGNPSEAVLGESRTLLA